MSYALELSNLFEESIDLSPKFVETKDEGFELRFKHFTLHGNIYSGFSYRVKSYYITSISTPRLLGLTSRHITFGSKFNFGHTSKIGKYILEYKETERKAVDAIEQAKIDAQDKKALELFKKLLEAEKKS